MTATIAPVVTSARELNVLVTGVVHAKTMEIAMITTYVPLTLALGPEPASTPPITWDVMMDFTAMEPILAVEELALNILEILALPEFLAVTFVTKLLITVLLLLELHVPIMDFTVMVSKDVTVMELALEVEIHALTDSPVITLAMKPQITARVPWELLASTAIIAMVMNIVTELDCAFLLEIHAKTIRTVTATAMKGLGTATDPLE